MKTTNEEFPLYPELTEHGKIEAQKVIDRFREFRDEIISDLNRDFEKEISDLKEQLYRR